MSDHPYAGVNTIQPGEISDDDPHSEKEYCGKCDSYVETISAKRVCPNCGNEI